MPKYRLAGITAVGIILFALIFIGASDDISRHGPIEGPRELQLRINELESRIEALETVR